MNDLPVITPTKPIGMETFAQLFGGPVEAQIPVAARDYVSQQWGNTGIGGRPEDFFNRLKVQRQQAAISAMPRNQEGFIVAPNRSPEGYAMPGPAPAPAPEQLATRGLSGGSGSARGEFATLQNQQPVSPLILDQGDPDLVKSQIVRGGSEAEKILLENTYGDKHSAFNWESRMTDKGINYSGIKPVRAGDELLKNKAFAALQARNPEQAAKVYHDLTGSDFGGDIAEKIKQRVARQHDFSKGIRAGIISGTLRRNPNGGWLEQKVSEPNPLGIGPSKPVWQPAAPELQQADMEFGSEALGVPRRPTMLDNVHPEDRGLFFSKFQEQVSSGKSEQEAATMALQSVRGKDSVANNVGVAQKAPVTQSKAGPAPQAPTNIASLQNVRNIIQGGAKNVHDEEYVKAIIESSDPIELRKLGFDDLAQMAATYRLRNRVQGFGQAISNVGSNIGDWIARNVSEPMQGVREGFSDVGAEINRSVYNFPNTVATAAGGQPLYNWKLPETPEETAQRHFAIRNAPRE